MKVLGQLVTPTRYLRIRAEGGDKLWVDFGLPAIATALVTAFWIWRPALIPMSGGQGLVSGVSGLMQILVGFYVATLAAIATFPASSLDELTNRITLDKKPLKRRRFLAYLFGHLAFLSILLVIAMLFRPLVEAMLADVTGPDVVFWIRVVMVGAYQFVFWQMIFVTLLGLHYLTDRIHRSDAS